MRLFSTTTNQPRDKRFRAPRSTAAHAALHAATHADLILTNGRVYAVDAGRSQYEAVAVAGGFTYRAIDEYAAVVRSFDSGTPEGRAVEGKASRQSFVQPGDVITIFERRF